MQMKELHVEFRNGRSKRKEENLTQIKISFDADSWVDMSIMEWAQHMASIFAFRLFPPYSIAQLYANKGEINRGMTAFMKWRPFTLNYEDYEQIRDYFLGDPQLNVKYVEPETPIDSEERWIAWKYEHEFGVPAHQHEEMLKEANRLKDALNHALSTGDDANIEALNDQYIKIGEERGRFIEPFMKRHHNS